MTYYGCCMVCVDFLINAYLFGEWVVIELKELYRVVLGKTSFCVSHFNILILTCRSLCRHMLLVVSRGIAKAECDLSNLSFVCIDQIRTPPTPLKWHRY